MPYTPRALSGPACATLEDLLNFPRGTLAPACHRCYIKAIAHTTDPPGDLRTRASERTGVMEVDTMLMRTDPFRELDRLTRQVFGTNGTLARPSVMPMDAWRDGDTFHVDFDLPGVDVDSIDLDVERNVLTVKAERPTRASDAELIAAERPRGIFSRQLVLGDNLDTEHIEASYNAGVLTLKIPVAERAKPRKIEISRTDEGQQAISACSRW